MPTAYKYKLTLTHEADTYDIDVQDVTADNYSLIIAIGTIIKGDPGENAIEGIQKNGIDITPDANKRVNVTVPTALADLSEDTTHRVVTDTEKSAWNAKYDKPSGGIPSTDLADGVIPDISGKANNSDKLADLPDLITNRESTTKYPSAAAAFAGLGQYGIVSQTQTWSGSGSNPRTYTMSNQVWGLIPQANIDLFVSVGATFNAVTGYFELNGLTDISYEEMRAIYDAGSPSFVGNIGLYGGKAVRTNRPLNSTLLYTNTSAVSATRMGYASNIEVLICKINGDDAADYLIPTTTLAYAFTNAYFLKKIDGFGLTSTISSQSYTSAFSKCYSLESIRLARLGATVSFSNSSLLDLASVVYMVDNAINTSAITITLHATAYARCQADTTEYTYGGQTYTGIRAYASARNITIAS